MDATIEKVSIIVSKGSFEGIYPALIMANGARAEGIEANLFFTFFGLDAINRKRHEHIKIATVGNPGLHLATLAGGLPGMPGVMTHYMERKMGKLDIPPIPEFIEMIADTGAGIYGCQASCDLFGITKDDLIDQVKDIITVGEFYALAAGGLPGMPGVMTHYLERKMDKLDIPPIPEFIEMIADTGAGLYGCQASCDLFGLTKDDLIEQVKDIITVGEFYALAAGGQIIFT